MILPQERKLLPEVQRLLRAARKMRFQVFILHSNGVKGNKKYDKAFSRIDMAKEKDKKGTKEPEKGKAKGTQCGPKDEVSSILLEE